MEKKRVILRCDRSGVYYGTLESQNGSVVTLSNARNIHYWNGAASTLQLAKDGTNNPNECRFTVYVDSITLLDAISVIPCTEKSIKSIESVKEWKK